MKKRLAYLTTSILTLALLWCMTLPLSAEAYTIAPAAETIRSYRQVYDAIYEAINAQQSYLNVSRWQIHDYEIMTIFTDVMYNSPEFFFADQKLVYRYNADGLVVSLSFTYNMSRTKRTECEIFYEQEISYLVQAARELQLSKPETALYVHDAIISSFAYDTEETVYDVYHFLIERRGVCQAYSLCYMAVLRELGIPCYMVVSEEMQHSWNLVEIDGQWYHVDLVYDDPQPDRPGQVLHNHFLLSDAAIAEDHGQGTHWGWSSIFRCEDDSYKDRFWQKSDTCMQYLNDMWYYVDDTDRVLYRTYFSGFNQRAVYTFTEHWYVDPAGVHDDKSPYWKGLYTGMGLYNGYLYINTPTTIWRVNPSSGETVELLSLDEHDLNIYGINIWINYWKNQMEYLVGDTPDRNTTAYIETIPMRYTDDDVLIENVFLPFEDISRVSPYYRSIEFLYERSIMTGLSATQFAPTDNMTRAQFAVLLSRMYAYDPSDYTGERLYTDVPTNSWYAPYVSWVTESGFMSGVGEGIFAPEQTVSREQMYAVLASMGRSQKLGERSTLSQLKSIDRRDIANWAIGGVDYCYTNGLIAERYHYAFSPEAPVKRGEMADVLYRFCQLQSTAG